MMPGAEDVFASAMRAHGIAPDDRGVIVADDDRLTPGNPGLTKARAAAAAVGGKVARPIWPDGIPIEASDINDAAIYLEGRSHG